MKRTSFLIPAILAMAGNSGARVYYADPVQGNDLYSGFFASPFKTFEKCVAALTGPGDVCELRKGTYYTTGPVATASGTAAAPIEIRAFNNEKVVIRQGVEVNWTQMWSDGTRAIWQADFDWNAAVAAQRSMGWFYERGIQIWRDHEWLPTGSAAGIPLSSENPMQILPMVEADLNTTSTTANNYPLWPHLGTPPANELVGSIAWVNSGNRLNWNSRFVTASSASTKVPGRHSFTIPSIQLEPMDNHSAYYLIGSPYLLGTAWEWGWDARKKAVYLMTNAGEAPKDYGVRVQSRSVALTLRNCAYWSIHDLTFEGVVPTIDGNTHNIQYHHLDLVQPGILQFAEKDFDYTQRAGLILGDDSRVHHSTISGCWGRCVDAVGARDTIDNNIIRSHTLRGQYEAAITLQKPDALVQRNQISTGNHSGVMVQSGAGGAVVRRNLFEDPGACVSDAAAVMAGNHAGKVVIDSNYIQALTELYTNGILLDQASSHNDVMYNVADMSGTFVTLACDPFGKDYSSNYNRIANNTVNGSAVFSLFRNIGTMTNSIVKDNIVAGYFAYGPYESYPTLRYRTDIANYFPMGLQYQGNLPSGTDPLYVDSRKGDFRLQAGSPAIDYGAVYQPGQWYLGAAPDAGAIEYGSQSWVYGPWDPPVMSNPALGFEDPSLWKVSWNGPAAQLSRTRAMTQGTYAMEMVPAGFVSLETGPLDQSVASGFSLLQIEVWLEGALNVYWPGQLQFYFDCPSLGIYNSWVGQVDLKQGEYTYAITIPTWLGDQLKGKTFTDLKIRMGVNVPTGTTRLVFDDLRLAD